MTPAQDLTALADKLLPCPFCGDHAGMYECDTHADRSFNSSWGQRFAWRVECAGKCHAMTCFWHSAEDAAKHWNARTALREAARLREVDKAALEKAAKALWERKEIALEGFLVGTWEAASSDRDRRIFREEARAAITAYLAALEGPPWLTSQTPSSSFFPSLELRLGRFFSGAL